MITKAELVMLKENRQTKEDVSTWLTGVDKRLLRVFRDACRVDNISVQCGLAMAIAAWLEEP